MTTTGAALYVSAIGIAEYAKSFVTEADIQEINLGIEAGVAAMLADHKYKDIGEKRVRVFLLFRMLHTVIKLYDDIEEGSLTN